MPVGLSSYAWLTRRGAGRARFRGPDTLTRQTAGDTCPAREIARADLVLVPSGQIAAGSQPIRARTVQQVAAEGAGR